jgi:DNA-binding transcriptional LysR family regulator
VESRFVSNDLVLLTEAAVQGLGIATLPALLIIRQLERGELVQVLREVVGTEARVALVYPEKELMPPQVRAFIEAVVAWARGRLGPLRLPGRAEGQARTR